MEDKTKCIKCGKPVVYGQFITAHILEDKIEYEHYNEEDCLRKTVEKDKT